ncbi:MAG: hypothetical protein AAFY60_17010, partial [Myxococcota bacterium]
MPPSRSVKAASAAPVFVAPGIADGSAAAAPAFGVSASRSMTEVSDGAGTDVGVGGVGVDRESGLTTTTPSEPINPTGRPGLNDIPGNPVPAPS